jgi:hypothetical protein
LGGRGWWISEFKASLVYKVSSRTTARAIQRNPVSKNQKKKKKKKKNSIKTAIHRGRYHCPLNMKQVYCCLESSMRGLGHREQRLEAASPTGNPPFHLCT